MRPRPAVSERPLRHELPARPGLLRRPVHFREHGSQQLRWLRPEVWRRRRLSQRRLPQRLPGRLHRMPGRLRQPGHRRQNCGACGAVCATGTACIQRQLLEWRLPVGNRQLQRHLRQRRHERQQLRGLRQRVSRHPGLRELRLCVDLPVRPDALHGSRNCVNTKTSGANCGACGNVVPERHGVLERQVHLGRAVRPEPSTARGGCCPGNACCSDGGCQTQHNNGVGQYYYDCTALGAPGRESSYSLALAKEAAAAAAPA